MKTPLLHRAAAALLSLAAIGTLALQTWVDTGQGFTTLGALWDQMLFFTNISVLLVAVICGWAALSGWPGVSWPAGLTVWIVLTGIVYHALLAGDHNPEGWDVLVNIFQHTVLPMGVLAAWLVFAPKAGLTAKHALYWTGFPLIYAVYALGRGHLGDRFPYFFLDPVKTGWAGVGLYILGLGALFFLVGTLLVGVARLLR